MTICLLDYGRTLGTIYVGGVNINWWMVEQGWAHQYVKYNSSAKLAALQAKAKTAKLGIWAAPGTIPPWEYRTGKKKQQSIAKARKRGGAVTLEYWLNTSSNSRHNSACKWYKKPRTEGLARPVRVKHVGLVEDSSLV